ncbi:MAG: fluoride efflux transporter CrcB [bacterium]
MALDWKAIVLVAAGAIVGALLRFGVSALVPSKTFPFATFPWATLAVNLAGAFAIGLLVLPSGVDHDVKMLVVVGFLGAFTTLSTYSVETVDLWRTSHRDLAVANMLANGLGGPLMAVAGWKVAVAFGAA